MKRFYCQCKHEIFFNNAFCDKCGRDLIYDPVAQTMWSGVLTDTRFVAHSNNSDHKEAPFILKPCNNRTSSIHCNWAVSSENDVQCISCKTTRFIPDLSIPKNNQRWLIIERAKRQLISSLISLNLPIENYREKEGGLAFDFLEDKRTNPNVNIDCVLTGHADGVITINAAEADEGFLHVMKEQMGEPYRTILGHFRHEVGHYYWKQLVQTDYQLRAFRELFGNEQQDYQQALEHALKNARQRAIDMLLERRVEALVYASYYHKEVQVPQEMLQVPSVLVNCYAENEPLTTLDANLKSYCFFGIIAVSDIQITSTLSLFETKAN